MTFEAEALENFKSFVASITYSDDHLALAAQLGQAKSLWADACLSLHCVRASAGQSYKPTTETKLRATGLLESLGLARKIEIERRD